MGASQRGGALLLRQTSETPQRPRRLLCDRRSLVMPEEYRHPAPNHPSAIDRSSVVRESWIVVSPGSMSPDQAHRPSLDTGSIRLVNPLAHPAPPPEEFRPPPPLIDLNSRTSSAGSIPHGASPPTVVTPSSNYKLVPDLAPNNPTRDRHYEAPNVHVPPTPREAIGHLDASQLHAKEDRESLLFRKRNRGSGMLGTMFGTHEPRGSIEDAESIHSSIAPEKVWTSHILISDSSLKSAAF